MSNEEKFCAVDVLIERMKTHPEEFFEAGEKRGRWAFMYKDYFKDSLSESEKGRILEALRTVRRTEFDVLVIKELMRDEEAEKRQAESQAGSSGYVSGAISGAGVSTTNSVLTANTNSTLNYRK